MAMITSSKKANLFAKSKEKVRLPKYAEEFPISEFLTHPSGIETLLNKRALQRVEPVDLNTYRCTMHRIQLLQFDAVPVVDLRVTPTSEDCKVEMLSCKRVLMTGGHGIRLSVKVMSGRGWWTAQGGGEQGESLRLPEDGEEQGRGTLAVRSGGEQGKGRQTEVSGGGNRDLGGHWRLLRGDGDVGDVWLQIG